MQFAFDKPAYDLVMPRKIVFGWGRRREAGRLARALGRRAIMVVGSEFLIAHGVVAELHDNLAAAGVELVSLGVIDHEPLVTDVDRLAGNVRELRAGSGDVLIGLGGGAAIDLAKALAALATNRQSPTVQDYLENVGRDLKLDEPPLPVMALPTTAGTGAEATRNAVISSLDPPFKKSLRDERLVPQVALVDPELTVSVPPAVTAASGMDAITQLLESFLSRKAQPIPQALCLQGLQLAVPAIVEAVRQGTSRPARERMAQAALLSGVALANSGLGMAHGVAAALGVHAGVAHGAACALMLPTALRVNLPVRQAAMADLGRMLFPDLASADEPAAAEGLVQRIAELCVAVGVPQRLSQVGVTAAQIPNLVAGSRGSSMSGNPRELSDEELTQILEDLL